MPTPSLTMFDTIMEIILSACKCARRRVSIREIVNPSSSESVNVDSTICERNEQTRPLSNTLTLHTLSMKQLEQTLKHMLAENGIEMNNEHFGTLLIEVSEELNEMCSSKLGDQYDFSIICTSDDYSEALTFQKDIENRFKLKGYMISDAVSLGRDHFGAFEDIVERSSIVIFYITNNFTMDEVCCHLARNTFVAPGDEKNKFIPVVDDLSTRLPDCLMLVQKIVRTNPFHINSRLRLVFSDGVKQEKYNRHIKLAEDVDSKRMDSLKTILVARNLIS